MTRFLGSWKLTPALLLLAACTASPPTSGPTTSEEAAALRTLERFNASATDAVKAVDQARDVSLYNLKNAKMVGFKRCTAVLQEGGRVLVSYDFTQGAAQVTGHTLDIMIEGPGFFMVKLREKSADGVGYVRWGSFFVNDKGQLVLNNENGYVLDPPISLPPNATDISIGPDGRVGALVDGAVTPQIVGQIMVAHFMNPENLVEVEPGIFAQTETSGLHSVCVPGEEGAGTLLQGALESSNVDITSETIRLQQLDQWREALLRGLNIRL